ncbi:MAG: hypothetical protein OXC11_12070 [Rhodospirillales bacterium]|nr:hypothetical protein [Rhodospirillales bacterium]
MMGRKVIVVEGGGTYELSEKALKVDLCRGAEVLRLHFSVLDKEATVIVPVSKEVIAELTG